MLCQSMQHNDFLLALDSNLTSVLNHSRDITPSVYSLQSNLSVVYDLLPLNSPMCYLHLSLLFNSSPSLHIHTHLSFKWNWKKMAGSRWTCFGVRVPRTLGYPTINLNPCQSASYGHNASIPERQMDEHHGNNATMCSNKCIAC